MRTRALGSAVLATLVIVGAGCGRDSSTTAAKRFSLVAEHRDGPETSTGITFTETLKRGANVVGHDKGVCTFKGDKADCRITVTLEDGTILVRGPLVPGAKVQRTPIVGGTGAYADARGMVISHQQSENVFRLDFDLS